MADLYWIHGAMNSSKSANLLMAWHNYEERGMKPLVVKPKLDTRDGEYIKSRALNVKRKAHLIVEKGDIGKIYKATIEYDADVVLVDEAQFLTKEQVDELGDITDFLEVPVMAYGLRTDFKGELFEGSKRLFEIYNEMQELTTVCPCCGREAIINMRIDENGKPVFNGEQIVPGHDYLPVCRKYYKLLREEYEQEEGGK